MLPLHQEIGDVDEELLEELGRPLAYMTGNSALSRDIFVIPSKTKSRLSRCPATPTDPAFAGITGAGSPAFTRGETKAGRDESACILLQM